MVWVGIEVAIWCSSVGVSGLFVSEWKSTTNAPYSIYTSIFIASFISCTAFCCVHARHAATVIYPYKSSLMDNYSLDLPCLPETHHLITIDECIRFVQTGLAALTLPSQPPSCELN